MLDTEVRDFLRTNRIGLDTDLGQHFLVRDDVLQDIVESAGIQPDEHIIEIGPGIGVLTRELLRKAKAVTAIEIDARFIGLLKRFVDSPTLPKLTVINGNALQARMPEHPYKVVANIPYHITSPLLRHLLLESSQRPTSLTLLIQREVAENISAETGSGLLAILVQLFGTATLVRTVAKDAFLPPPEVESAVLHIQPFDQPKVDTKTAGKILNLAKVGFSQKRKMLNNSIGKLPGGPEALTKLGIDMKRRPETLVIDEWIALQQALAESKA